MTDKQSTVVVSRELLERIEAGVTVCNWAEPIAELRALLAAPVEQQSTWESLARKLAWYLPGALEANAPHMTAETMHDALEALDQVRKMPVEQQGEPVTLPEVLPPADARCPRHHLIADGFRAGADWMRREVEKLGPLYPHVPPPTKDCATEQLQSLISAVRSINHGPRHSHQLPGNDEPCYLQRKEWVEWILGICDEAEAALKLNTPQ